MFVAVRIGLSSTSLLTGHSFSIPSHVILTKLIQPPLHVGFNLARLLPSTGIQELKALSLVDYTELIQIYTSLLLFSLFLQLLLIMTQQGNFPFLLFHHSPYCVNIVSFVRCCFVFTLILVIFLLFHDKAILHFHQLLTGFGCPCPLSLAFLRDHAHDVLAHAILNKCIVIINLKLVDIEWSVRAGALVSVI